VINDNTSSAFRRQFKLLLFCLTVSRICADDIKPLGLHWLLVLDGCPGWAVTFGRPTSL